MAWTLDLEYAGRTFAFTDEIDTQVTEQFSVFSGVIASVAEISLSLDLGIDVPQAVEDGYDLSGIVGTLQLDGTTVMIGRSVGRPLYGDPLESEGIVHFTLRESVIDDTSKIPGPLAKVDATTWPGHDPAYRDKVYPIVFGDPGNGVCPGSPAYLLDLNAAGDQLILIAGHPVTAPAVRIHNYTAEYVDTYTVIHRADGRGQVVAAVDAQELPGNVMAEGDELWCEWLSDASPGGGGDLVAYMLAHSTMRTDPGRLDAAMALLNSYRLAGYIEKRVSPLEWVGDNLLPILPFSLARDADGLYPLVYNHRSLAAHASAHLIVGADCTPTSAVRYDGEPLTELSLKYKLRADTGDYLSSAVATEDNNTFAAKARARYRNDAHDGRYAEDIETDFVYDDATADLVVAQIMERRALRARTTTYRLDRDIWGARVYAGTFVTITDTDRSWSRKPVWVISRTDGTVDMSITVLVKDEPGRDLH